MRDCIFYRNVSILKLDKSLQSFQFDNDIKTGMHTPKSHEIVHFAAFSFISSLFFDFIIFKIAVLFLCNKHTAITHSNQRERKINREKYRFESKESVGVFSIEYADIYIFMYDEWMRENSASDGSERARTCPRRPRTFLYTYTHVCILEYMHMSGVCQRERATKKHTRTYTQPHTQARRAVSV